MKIKTKHTVNPFMKYEASGLKLPMEETNTISNLSKTAMRLYLFIREYSFRMDGCVVFDIATAKDLCGFKQNKSVYNALNELVENSILAKTEDSIEFFYNPKFIGHEKE